MKQNAQDMEKKFFTEIKVALEYGKRLSKGCLA